MSANDRRMRAILALALTNVVLLLVNQAWIKSQAAMIAAYVVLAVEMYLVVLNTREVYRGRHRSTGAGSQGQGAIRSAALASYLAGTTGYTASRTPTTGAVTVTMAPRARPGVDLPEVKDAEPLLAWRLVVLTQRAGRVLVHEDGSCTWTPGRWQLHPITSGGGGTSEELSIDARATCRVYEGVAAQMLEHQVYVQRHKAPDVLCTCGFYSYKDRSRSWVAFNAGDVSRALARVDLSGLVVEHQYGYRAERQRILALEVAPALADHVPAIRESLGVEVKVCDTYAPTISAYQAMFTGVVAPAPRARGWRRFVPWWWR